MFGAVANFFPNFLRDLLHNDSGNGVTNLLWYLNTDLFRYFLLHVHWILSTNCFGEFFAFFSRYIDREILATFIRNFFALSSGDLLLNFLGN